MDEKTVKIAILVAAELGLLLAIALPLMGLVWCQKSFVRAIVGANVEWVAVSRQV